MSRTLTLIDRIDLIDAGWQLVRSAAAHGRRADALSGAVRLLARPDLPASVAAEAHRLAGELLIDAERYPEARRHLSAAAAFAPTCARAFHLWGLAHERDPHGRDRRAARCFKRAGELEPANELYRAAFGRAAVRCGAVKTGVRELEAALAAAPGELEVVRVAVGGLTEAGKFGAARRALTRARFLCPAGRELAALAGRVRFEAARARQRRSGGRRGTTRHAQDAELARDGGRVVLPLIRVAGVGGTYRQDVVSFPKPHFPRLMVRKADR
jgi:tetratricopeptide (TPR) repeat protein